MSEPDRTNVQRAQQHATAWSDRLDLVRTIEARARELGFNTEVCDVGTGVMLYVTLLSGARSFVLSVMAFDEKEFPWFVADDANLDEANFVEAGMIVDDLVLEPTRIPLFADYSRPASDAVTSMMHGFKGILDPNGLRWSA